MDKIRKFLLRGVFFALLLFIIVFIVKQIIGFTSEVIQPVSKLLPDSFSVLTSTIITWILLLLLGGLFGFSKTGKRIFEKTGFIIPGFSIIVNRLEGEAEVYGKKIETCLATVDDAWLYGLIIEDNRGGLITVYIPGAPSPNSGMIYFLKEEQIKRLDISAMEVFKRLMQFGNGSKHIVGEAFKT